MPKEIIFVCAVLLTFVAGTVSALSRRLQQLLFLLLVLSTTRLNPDVQFGFMESIEKHRGTVWGFRYTVTDLLGLVLLISLVVAAVMGRTAFRPFPRGSLALWGVIGAGLLSLISAKIPIAGWFEINNLVLGFLIFVAVANFIQTENDLKFVVGTLLCALAIPAVVGFKQHFQFLLGMRYMGRVRGTTPHPNILAIYLNALFPVCLLLTLTAKRFSRRALLAGLCMVTSATLMFTLSRGGLAGMAFASALTLLFWMMWWRGRGKFLKTIMVLILLTPVGVKWAPLFLSRITSQEAQVSKRGREEMTESALQQWHDQPVTGIGMNNYALLRDTANVHNSYVLFLVETGVVGLMAFVFMLTTFVAVAFRNVTRAPPGSLARLMSIGIAVGLSVLCLQLYAEFAIRSENIHFLFHVLAGIVAGTRRMLIAQRTAVAADLPVAHRRKVAPLATQVA